MLHMIDRRTFIKSAAVGAGAFMSARRLLADQAVEGEARLSAYSGPNIIIVRFGGGVRRTETIEPGNTYCPYTLQELVGRGTFYPLMEISESTRLDDGRKVAIATSHGEGTLNILTGKYDEYIGVGHRHPDKYDRRLLDDRFEARVPTLFEYFRRTFDIPSHQALLVNGEDRTQEEFYSFSNHHLFGVDYRCTVLSLYRFKCHLLRRRIEAGQAQGLTDQKLKSLREELAKMESLDYRDRERLGQGAAVDAFWEDWRGYYGDTGFVNERGDRLLTDLAIRAIRQLQPRLMMINYNDPDYVHWGNVNHYTRAIAIIDRELQRLVEVVDHDERYRNNTVFAIVPDCGRDNARLSAVPLQHHFNSKTSRQIWALLMGPGIERGVVVDKPVEQIAVAPTLGALMGLRCEFAEGDVLQEALA